MALRAILTSLFGRAAGLDPAGNPVWNRRDGSQLLVEMDALTGVPQITTTTPPTQGGITRSFTLGAAASSTVALFANIAALDWTAAGIAPVNIPAAITTSGYGTAGVGAATYFRLPNTGPSAYTLKRYRIMDSSGYWWALSRTLAATQMQVGAVGDAKLIGATKTGPALPGGGQGVGSGVTGGTPTGTDDSAAFTDFLDGYLKVRIIEPRSHIVGDVRVPSFTTIYGAAAAGYTGNAQGVGYDPVNGADFYTEKGIPYFYVKLGAQAAFNVANNTAADQAAGIDPITYGYGIDMQGIAIDAWTDNTQSTDARSCISAGGVRIRMSNMHLIRATYGVGGAATGGSVYSHGIEMSQCTVATCWRGFANFIDSFVDAQVANCYQNNIFGTNGSNALKFTGRNEFCQGGHGIELQTCAICTFDDALCDRNWLAGARLTSCTRCNFGVGWEWQRNGRGQVGVDDDECNLFRQGCFYCDDYGTHGRGADDFNGTSTFGNFTPRHCATYNQTNPGCQDKGNHANGFTSFAATVETGTAQAGSATTITLATGASGESGYYNGLTCTITSGTASGSTGLVTGYSGGSHVCQVPGGWSAGTPDATSVYSFTTGASSLLRTGPIYYMSTRTSTTMPSHVVNAGGSEIYDNGRVEKVLSGRRVYDYQFSASLAAAGGTDSKAFAVLGPATNFAIQSMKLRVVARDGNTPSTSYTGECMLRVREETASPPAIETGPFVISSEIGASGYVGFGAGVFTTGTCQAGSTATTIVLASGASSTTDGFVGATVTTTGGTGSGQSNVCTGYNGTSKTMSLKRPWATTPDNTTTYSISFGSIIQLAISSPTVTPHPTDGTMQLAGFTMSFTNRHASNAVRVFAEVMQ